VACWGSNANGQLGLGPNVPDGTTNIASPTTVASSPTNASFVAAGGNHTCVATKDQKLLCWGEGADGEIGNGQTSDTPTPTPVQGF
jgi:alpha-tubulin suppressor-like RCC1 family protein